MSNVGQLIAKQKTGVCIRKGVSLFFNNKAINDVDSGGDVNVNPCIISWNVSVMFI